MNNLSSYLTFSNGRTSPKKIDNGNYPVFGANGIIGYSNESNAEGNTIIIGRVGAYCGSVHFSNTKCWVTDNAISVSCNEKAESSFWFYYLKFLNLNNMKTGSGQPLLNQTILKSINVDDQIASLDRVFIGNKLSELDQKIQLNTQINQTLEQIAQAIFKSWFIDFDPVKAKAEAKAQGATDEQANIAAMSVISGKSPDQLNAYKQTNPTDYQQLHQLAQAFPSEFEEIDGVEVPKGWGVETLSEVSSMRNGYAFKSNEWTEEGIPVIKIGSIKPMIVEVEGNGFVSEENKSSRPNFVVKEGDILVGLTGYVGEVGRMPQHKIAMLNQRVAKFIPNKIDNKYSFYSFIYCSVRSSKFKEYATINAKGSAQANISTNELLKYPIIKATDNIHISFEKYVENILDKILKNSGENEFLEKTRDLLLPKLLSGDI